MCLTVQSIGFASEFANTAQKTESELLQMVETDDLIKVLSILLLFHSTAVWNDPRVRRSLSGCCVAAGECNVWPASFLPQQSLTEEALMKILVEPKNALISQFEALFAMDHVCLVLSYLS